MSVLTHRFWAKVRKDDSDCWIWTGAVQSSGYGCWSVAGKRVLAHRIAYTELVGPIPDGLQLDHLCRVKLCVNPAHLEPVTQAVNMARTPAALATHCHKGHPFEGDNVGRTGKGQRRCMACNRETAARWREKKRSERAAAGAPVRTYRRRRPDVAA